MATVKSEGNGKQTRKAGPVFAKTYFPVEVAVFEHENDGGRLNYSVKLAKSFKRDEESEWETSEYLSPQELLPAAKLLEEAYAAIQARLQKAARDRRARDQAHAEGDAEF